MSHFRTSSTQCAGITSQQYNSWCFKIGKCLYDGKLPWTSNDKIHKKDVKNRQIQKIEFISAMTYTDSKNDYERFRVFRPLFTYTNNIIIIIMTVREMNMKI